ncbi:Zn(II)2Cys6 transcription factor domain-containing protein [Aspergillus stella-maris]|uniref:Zn(II)2Cys6 transcription factor domain-containing protein n=1 Tax=Aspergillus stella-maris TaxID=1810926 RepID=UPI003CCCCF7C
MSDSKKPPIRACTNCVRAKAKCSPRLLKKCDRCLRMNKECHASPPVRKRRATKVSKSSQVQKLEERVDGLVVMLQAATNTNTKSTSNSTSIRTPESTNTFNSHHTGLSTAQDTAGTTEAAAPSPFIPPSAAQVDPAEAEVALDRFRNVFLPNLPFMTLSSSVKAQELRRDSPLLWLSIISVSLPHPSLQSALSDEARAIFAREGYIVGTRSIDFLWALLVYVTWDRFHTWAKCPSLSLVHLAAAVMYDLALDKPLSYDAGLGLMYDVKGMKRAPMPPRAPGLEEKRAVLGCFLVSTVRSMHGKGESLKWTSIFDQYVRDIEEAQKFPSDSVLVQLVKLRLVTETATEYFASCATSSSATGRGAGSGLDATAMLKSLEGQLRAVRTQIPPYLLENKTIAMELLYTDATIHQIGFNAADAPFSIQSTHRFTCIYSCLQAVKSWVETFLSLPPGSYIGLSTLNHNEMMRCLMNICRLAICDHPEWDGTLLHENINVSVALEETSKRFAQARGAAGMESGDMSVDMHALISQRTLGMKSFWDSLTMPTPESTEEMGLGTAGWMSFVDELGNFSEEFLGLWDFA